MQMNRLIIIINDFYLSKCLLAYLNTGKEPSLSASCSVDTTRLSSINCPLDIENAMPIVWSTSPSVLLGSNVNIASLNWLTDTSLSIQNKMAV